jgi:phenylacetate-CoA ligase
LLSSIDGREVDRIKTASGSFISCLYFVHLMKDIPEVLEFQVQQRSVNDIRISVVVSEVISEKSRALFDSEMKKVLGEQVSVTLAPVDSIARSRSGKHKAIIGIE